MIFYLKYSGKLVLSFKTRSEQLAIDQLYALLRHTSIEDVMQRLTGFHAAQAAIDSPDWGAERKGEAIADFAGFVPIGKAWEEER